MTAPPTPITGIGVTASAACLPLGFPAAGCALLGGMAFLLSNGPEGIVALPGFAGFVMRVRAKLGLDPGIPILLAKSLSSLFGGIIDKAPALVVASREHG